ncbi:hypothetical protein BURMUCGD1_3904 [Burkholderia multivorans CGD1]|nr:hypothetical protein BURMUCGD1_3904 [Burkholderia multivorans CGD1]
MRAPECADFIDQCGDHVCHLSSSFGMTAAQRVRRIRARCGAA